jgi:hypothetical protein
MAQAIKNMRDTWALQLELQQLKADLARARYLQLIKAGFAEDQALELCQKDISL